MHREIKITTRFILLETILLLMDYVLSSPANSNHGSTCKNKFRRRVDFVVPKGQRALSKIQYYVGSLKYFFLRYTFSLKPLGGITSVSDQADMFTNHPDKQTEKWKKDQSTRLLGKPSTQNERLLMQLALSKMS